MTAAPRSDAADVASLVRAAGPGLQADLEAVERLLRDEPVPYGPAVAEPAAATIAAGGKRIRPLLVLIAAGRSGADRPSEPPLQRAAAAVELVHVATLVHDDVLDDASTRRGRPTVHAEHGRDRATAVGDLLFSRAFAVLVRNGDRAQVKALSRAGSALARGELLQREDAYDARVTVARYMLRCELKTARLFEAACRLGVLAGPADRAERAGDRDLRAGRMGDFGLGLGLAFQLLDDVLDVSGPTARTGKPRGADLLDGTVTLPLILARQSDPALAELDLRAIEAGEAERICERIEATGALERVREMAAERVAAAIAGLGDDLEPGHRAALEQIAESVVARYA